MDKKLNCCGISTNTLTDMGLLIFRLAIGVLMLTHGWQKFSNFATLSTVFPDPIGWGSTMSLTMIVFAELVCSILIILGLFTRLSAVPLIIGMLVAAFIVHGADPFQVKELAILYMFGYILLAFTGAGKFSVDNYLDDFYVKYLGAFYKKDK